MAAGVSPASSLTSRSRHGCLYSKVAPLARASHSEAATAAFAREAAAAVLAQDYVATAADEA